MRTLEFPIWTQTWDQVSRHIRKLVGKPLWDQVLGQIRNPLWDQIDDPVWEPIMDRMIVVSK